MDTPRFKIGDKVYTWGISYDPPKCPTCNQENYGVDSYDNTSYWTISVRESTVVGLRIQEGVNECADGVSYQLDTQRWVVEEDTLYPTSDEARAVAEAHVKERQETNRKAFEEEHG